MYALLAGGCCCGLALALAAHVAHQSHRAELSTPGQEQGFKALFFFHARGPKSCLREEFEAPNWHLFDR